MTQIFDSKPSSLKLMMALALAIVVGLLLAPASWADHEEGHYDSAFLAENPELLAVRRYAAAAELDAAAFLAENTELLAVRRYAAAAELDTASFLAENTELLAVRRYAAAAELDAAAFLAENTEFLTVRRYAALVGQGEFSTQNGPQ